MEMKHVISEGITKSTRQEYQRINKKAKYRMFVFLSKETCSNGTSLICIDN